MFREPGFYASDNSGAAVRVSTVGLQTLQAALNSTSDAALRAASQAAGRGAGVYGPWVLAYTPTDEAGNAGEAAQRHVFIDAACPDGEVRCESHGGCSQGGTCFAALLQGSKASAATYTPPVDTQPPKLMPRMKGSDRVLVPASDGGIALVETSIAVGSRHSDAGATAIDAIDGDVSSRVSSYGLKSISTAAPTPASAPYVVRYHVADAAGNAAEAARIVRAVCAASEHICRDGSPVSPSEDGSAAAGDGAPICSEQGLCLPASAVSSESAAEPAPPTLRLVGPAEVFVMVGQPYARCPRPRPVALVCDQVRLCPPCAVRVLRVLHEHQASIF